jgi:hypothetical protein
LKPTPQVIFYSFVPGIGVGIGGDSGALSEPPEHAAKINR